VTDLSNNNFLEDIISDPNLLGILVGAAIWIVGLYTIGWISFVGVILNTIGFTLTCFATAASALKRPVNQAWIGLLIGVIFYVLGPFIPLFYNFIFVAGAVMILFFAIPMAIQTGKVPMMENLQEFLDMNIKEKKEKQESEPIEADTEETPDIDSPSEEQSEPS